MIYQYLLQIIQLKLNHSICSQTLTTRHSFVCRFVTPEGYSVSIGGSERINDLELLEQRIDEHQLDTESYNLLDLRRYGSVHSGFGLGLERTLHRFQALNT